MKTGKYPIIISVSIGGIAGVLLSVLFAGITALLIHNGKVNTEALSYIVPLIHIFTSFSGSMITKALTDQRKGIAATATGAAYILLLILTNLLLSGGEFSGVIITCICVMIGAVAAALLFNSTGRSKRMHKHKVRFR